MSEPQQPIHAEHASGSNAPYAPLPPTIIVKQSGGWLKLLLPSLFGLITLGIFGAVLIAGMFGASLTYYDTTGGITEKYHSGSTTAASKIAIVKVTGVIMEGDGFVRHQINKIREDDTVKAVIVRVDTPGGTVTGSDYIFHHLKKLREEKQIPMVVSMGGMATSGGYYVSMAVGDQEKSIYAEPTTTTGSIGVIMPHYDLTGLMERWEIEDDSIVTHENKQLTSMTRELTPEKRAILQRYIDQSFERFKDIVKEGRPVFKNDPDALNQLATGEIFSAPTAKEHGLVDELGFIEDAAERAAELAGLSEDEYFVVEYKSPPSLLGEMSLMQAQSQHSQLDMMLQLSTPRAYYLTTTLPLLFTTDRLRN